ncbi:MAG: hypothetical protein ABI488_19275 [Polyangiaceae bacterium]
MNQETLTGPSWHSLFHGAVRESLAAANSVARIGIQDTRAWERPMRYVADDNGGNVGIVEFLDDGAVGAMSARAPKIAIDRAEAIAFAPAGLRDQLVRICELPLLQEGLGVSAIFWTVGASIQGSRSWDDICANGAHLFEHEFLPDREWEETGAQFYNLTPDVARLVIAISARAAVRVPVLHLAEHELRMLVARGCKHESTAVDLLLSEGLFEMAPDDRV